MIRRWLPYPLLSALLLLIWLLLNQSITPGTILLVARLILRRDVQPHSGFVAIPLVLTDQHGLAVLACIITSTTGTIWVSYDSNANILVIHVLNLVDEQSWIDSIKQRYERPLLEIFQ